uniref:Transcription factor GAMYB n=1 Tax=Ananas comosus var. bracteatus TaxID=296719 RepID=A0A6V7PFP7_ANACO|nr:unnamed protein product [Ananas comosus var. bracteatus]
MKRAREESDNEMAPNDQIGSPSANEDSSGGSSADGVVVLKKGPWTADEDSILSEYVEKFGEGNWNNVQKTTGLARNGKSCRLRWANHLRPNLKKCPFSPEEEQLVAELHAQIGNKWARMATQLTGRTDNEIKNYWNTRIKRQQRAGLPLYPPNVCARSKENQQSEFNCGDKQPHELLQGNTFNISDITFDNLHHNQVTLPYAYDPQRYIFTNSMNTVNQPTESGSFFPGYSSGMSSGFPSFKELLNEPGKIQQTFGVSNPYYTEPSRYRLDYRDSAFLGSQSHLNGNLPASGHITSPMKPELPSLQDTETDTFSCLENPTAPPTPCEPTDSYFQYPAASESVKSEYVSSQHDGLLDALVHQSLGKVSTKNQLESFKTSPTSSVASPGDMFACSELNNYLENLAEYNDPISPLGFSAASVFNVSTPQISGGSLNEFPPTEVPSGFETTLPADLHFPDLKMGEQDTLSHPGTLRPDALLGSFWRRTESSQGTNEQSPLDDAMAMLPDEDLGDENKTMP